MDKMVKQAQVKQQLRQEMTAKRGAISDIESERGAAEVVSFVGSLTAMEDVESVSVYYPVRGEFDSLPLLRALSAMGIETSLPVVGKKQLPLSFYPWKPEDPLENGAFEIPVPADRSLSVVPDVIIMPLLGFDANGHRLGYGGGYYDRTLEALRPLTDVRAVGLAWDFQEVPVMPAEPHDQQLDHVLTPTGLRSFLKDVDQ